MIKDPLFNDETPYDILEVPPHANHNEVHQALPRFMRNRKNAARIGKAQDAVKKLKNPNERSLIDIFYYSITEISEGLGDEGLINFNLKELFVVPSINTEDIYTDLDKTDFSDEFIDYPFNKIKLSELSRYDEHIYKLELAFDK